VKNVLEEQAYMALLKTMSQPRNQWHEQLLAQAEDEPISQQKWPVASKPKYEQQNAKAKSAPVIYDWPENEVM
jgi:hypothetical protein